MLYDNNLLKNFNPVATSYCQLFGISEISAIRSAVQELPPRIRANPANYRQKYFPADSAERSADSAANWRKSSLEKCPPTKTYLTPLLLAKELLHWTAENYFGGSSPDLRGTGRSLRVFARI